MRLERSEHVCTSIRVRLIDELYRSEYELACYQIMKIKGILLGLLCYLTGSKS